MSDTSTSSNRSTLWVVVGLVVVVGVFVVTFLSSGTGGSDYEVEGFGDVEVEGNLPPLAPGAQGVVADDAAVGMKAPEIRGTDYNGETVELVDDGVPKIVVFLAHWCGFCQAEVPQLVERLGDSNVQNGVEFYFVATASNRTRDNWSPAAWLDREGLPGPIIMDDVDTSALDAYGIGAFPGWAMIGADGTIVARATGQLGADVVDALILLTALPE
jgi:thiol-disulfide isomerase/thioredoxin